MSTPTRSRRLTLGCGITALLTGLGLIIYFTLTIQADLRSSYYPNLQPIPQAHQYNFSAARQQLSYEQAYTSQDPYPDIFQWHIRHFESAQLAQYELGRYQCIEFLKTSGRFLLRRQTRALVCETFEGPIITINHTISR